MSARGWSDLLTTRMSAISRMPALIACTSSPAPGTLITIVVWAVSATSTSSCPAPTVSTMITSLCAASITVTTSFAGGAPGGGVLSYPLHDVQRRGPGAEYPLEPQLLQLG